MAAKKSTRPVPSDIQTGTKILIIVFILAMLFITSVVFAAIVGIALATDSDTLGEGNVALIPVDGVITTASSGGGLYSTQVATSSDIVGFIRDADKDDGIEAIVMQINSPGGSPVATDEISQALLATDKPTVAYIRELGASGGYWIAASTDHIIANKMSLTGSVGVIGSYLEFAGLMDDYNVTYRRYVAGKYKDIGTPFKEATDMEQFIFQQKLDLLHDYFKEHVQERRNLSDEQMQEVGTGVFYLGAEALDLGLVDELGSKDEVTAYLNTTYNITPEYVTYQKPRTLLDELFGMMEHVGIGIGTGLRPDMSSGGIDIRY